MIGGLGTTVVTGADDTGTTVFGTSSSSVRSIRELSIVTTEATVVTDDVVEDRTVVAVAADTIEGV